MAIMAITHIFILPRFIITICKSFPANPVLAAASGQKGHLQTNSCHCINKEDILITIVYGHPYGKSFNRAILDSALASLQARNLDYTLIDLYGDGFDPAVREQDLALYSCGQTNDALAQKYMEILGKTAEIIYIFPVWWGVEPAIVKGFHDKVLLKDFAWSYSPEGNLQPKLQIDKTTIFTTSDAPGDFFAAYFNDYLPMHVFAAVGMGNVSWHNFGNILRSTSEERADFLRLVAQKV